MTSVDGEHPSVRWGRRYALALMALVSASQMADRQLLSVVMEPIKREFLLSDTQIGFLNGTVFGTAYALGALPFAVLADRWSRKKIIAATLALWSIMTTVTAGAGSFFALVATRSAVGFSEAGAGPALLALLSRLYPPEKRSGMVAALTVMTSLSAFAAFWLAGVVTERFGWRALFLVFGLPGLALAIAIWKTIGDGPRASGLKQSAGPMTNEVRAVLFQVPLVHLFGAACWNGIISAGTQGWMSSYLLRTFQMPISKVGLWMGVSAALAGLVGAVIGGVLTDRLSRRDPLAGMRICTAAVLLNLPLSLALFWVTSEAAAISLLLASTVTIGVAGPPIASAMLNLMPDRVRATAMAILSMGILFVAGLGPAIVGSLSDALAGRGDSQALRHGLLMVSCLGVLPVLHFAALLVRSRRLSAPVAA